MDKCKIAQKGTLAVPFVVYEAAMARKERTIKRLVFSLIVIVSVALLSHVIR